MYSIYKQGPYFIKDSYDSVDKINYGKITAISK